MHLFIGREIIAKNPSGMDLEFPLRPVIPMHPKNDIMVGVHGLVYPSPQLTLDPLPAPLPSDRDTLAPWLSQTGLNVRLTVETASRRITVWKI